MALDMNELQQLAAMLGDVLGPRIREAVAENVSARIGALGQVLRDEVAEQQKELTANFEQLAKQFADTAASSAIEASTKALAEQAKANDSRLVETIKSAEHSIAEQVLGLEKTFVREVESRFTEVKGETEKALTELATKAQSIEQTIADLPALPKIPEPTKLLVSGDFSDEMRAVLELAAKQIVAPMLEAALHPVNQQLQTVEEAAAAQSKTIEANYETASTSARGVADQFQKVWQAHSETGEALKAATEQLTQSASALTTIERNCVEAIAAFDGASKAVAERVDAELGKVDKRVTQVNEYMAETLLAVEKRVAVADEAATAKLAATEQVVKASIDELRKEQETTSQADTRVVNTVAAELREAMSNVATQVDERLKAANEAATAQFASNKQFVNASIEATHKQQSEYANQVLTNVSEQNASVRETLAAVLASVEADTKALKEDFVAKFAANEQFVKSSLEASHAQQTKHAEQVFASAADELREAMGVVAVNVDARLKAIDDAVSAQLDTAGAGFNSTLVAMQAEHRSANEVAADAARALVAASEQKVAALVTAAEQSFAATTEKNNEWIRFAFDSFEKQYTQRIANAASSVQQTLSIEQAEKFGLAKLELEAQIKGIATAVDESIHNTDGLIAKTVASLVEKVELHTAGVKAVESELNAALKGANEAIEGLQQGFESTSGAIEALHKTTVDAVAANAEQFGARIEAIRNDAVAPLAKQVAELATSVDEIGEVAKTTHLSIQAIGKGVRDEVIELVQRNTDFVAASANENTEAIKASGESLRGIIHQVSKEFTDRVDTLQDGWAKDYIESQTSIAEQTKQAIEQAQTAAVEQAKQVAELVGKQAIEYASKANADAATETANAFKAMTDVQLEQAKLVEEISESLTRSDSTNAELIDGLRKEFRDTSETVVQTFDSITEKLGGVTSTVDAALVGVREELSTTVQRVTSESKAAAESAIESAAQVAQGFDVAKGELQVQFNNFTGAMDKAIATRLQWATEAITKVETNFEAVQQHVTAASTETRGVVDEIAKTVAAVEQSAAEVAGNVRVQIEAAVEGINSTVSEAVKPVFERQQKDAEALLNRITEVTKTVTVIEQRSAELASETSVRLEAIVQGVDSAVSEAVKPVFEQQQKDTEALQTRMLGVAKAVADVEQRSAELASETSVRLEAIVQGVDSAVSEAVKPVFEQQQKDAEALLQRVHAVQQGVTASEEGTRTVLDAFGARIASTSEAIPEQIKEHVAAWERPVFEAAASAAKAVLAESIEQAMPELAAAARTAAVGAVPEAVQGQAPMLTEAVRDAVLPAARDVAEGIAREAASKVNEACAAVTKQAESAIETTRSEAVGAVKVAVEAAAEGLRESLLQALDPAEHVTKAVGEALPAQVDTFVKAQLEEIEPRVLVQLAAQMQKEIDRIPVPRDGLPGKDGHDGIDGKDGRVPTPVPYEHGRQYKHGEWVAHSNGVWVAARNTDTEPQATSPDWDCVSPGIKAVETLLLGDGRTIEIHTELSNGVFNRAAFKLPIPVNRGLYDAAREYDKHDVCVYNGSQWEAQKAGVIGRPGTDITGWKLIVKNGRDGKDLKQAPAAVLVWKGTWQPDTLYNVNEIVEHAGVRWAALRSNRERPPFTTLMSNDTWTKLGS